jgi:flagellar M-ring protein FliF
MARTIEELLEKTVGFGNVRAEVNADMDFDRVSTTEEIYNPDGQVVRSTQTVERAARNQESEGDAVTVGTNLPDAAPGGGDAARAQSDETSTEETVNFEISKKTVNHVRTDGEIKRVTVAVLVNGIQGKDEEGNQTYTPRPTEQMELLATLVRSTIGFDADRGDSVEVVNMEFASPVRFEEPLELFFGLGKNDLLRLAEILVLSILGILVILLVVRPLVSRAFESIPSAHEAAGRLLADTSSQASGLLGGPSAPAPAEMEEEQFEELIDIDRVEGRVKASSVKKVGEIVEKHPEEALSIIRAWMYQEA